MRILVTGARGMLGRTLLSSLPGHDVLGVDMDDGDLGDEGTAHRLVAARRPDVIVHGAAMTAVDACEAEPTAAFRANAEACGHVAAAARRARARLVVVSTDYVFDGALGRPYREDDPTAPRTVYGASKLAGEEAARRRCPDCLVVRIAWLYGPGGPSFVHTMLRLAAEADAPPVRVVNDQRGNPTSTRAVADHLDLLLAGGASGVVHLTCEGDATWYDLARRVFDRTGSTRPLEPCTTAEYPRPAPRPADSRLEKAALRDLGLPPMPAWESALDAFLAENPRG